ncbi:hypothetical protein [Luteirhabdus pelagi]|uniref:hypothetical protein n=1 Tax=Luteirhabdus pelagi TaxID=2792783 RepID=UPI001939B7A5|nr:hypothetical protein [Luteirhabdus pelagi]
MFRFAETNQGFVFCVLVKATDGHPTEGLFQFDFQIVPFALLNRQKERKSTAYFLNIKGKWGIRLKIYD